FVIRVSNRTKSLRDLEVLKGTIFQVDRCEVVVIIGASGSGKSTLLLCLNLLEQPDAGQLEVGGVAVDVNKANRINTNKLKMQTSMAFQHYNCLKIKQNKKTLPTLKLLKKNYKKKRQRK